MMRLSALFWIALVALTGFGMFKVKYGVQSLEDELNRVRKHTVAEQQEMRVLNAEWSYLTQPERLADLNRRFVSLAPIPTKEYQQSLADLPLRPRPADEVVAAPPPVAPVVDDTSARVIQVAAKPAAATRQSSPVQLVRASAAAKGPRSLDALFAQINEGR